MSIKEKITSGLKWSALSKGVSQLVSWSVTIYVIRLLEPSDYGLMAMIAVVIAFLSTFNEFGLGSALVQSKELDDESIGSVYGAMLLVGAALSVLLALMSSLIAYFFEEPRLEALITVAGIQFLMNATTIVPESMMRRNMTFKPLSIADIVGIVSGSLATLILAIDGRGVWALVIGNLTGAFIRLLILISLNPRRVGPNFRLRGAAKFLSFGGYITATRFISYFSSQADILIGAKLLGKEALGLYTVSLQLASLPVDKTMSMVNQVAFSAISRVQDQKKKMQQGLLTALRWLTYLAFPAIYGLASVAPEFIPFVLGPTWTGAILPLQLVALVMPLRMINALFATANAGMGRADISFKNTLVGACILPICFIAGVQWGAVGLAASWLVGSPIVFLLNFRRTSKVIGLSGSQVFNAISIPFFSVASMVFSLIILRLMMPADLSQWLTLLCLVGSGAAFYLLTAVILDVRLRDFIELQIKKIL